MNKLFIQRNFINVIFLLALISMLISGALAFIEIRQYIQANRWVIHTHQVLNAADKVLLTVNKFDQKNISELKSKQSVLDINNISNELKTNVNVLKNLTTDNPAQQKRISELENLLQKKTQLFSTINVVNNENGVNLDALIDKYLFSIKQAETKLLETRSRNLDKTAEFSRVLLLTFISIATILFILNLTLLNLSLKSKEKAEKKQRKSENELLKSNLELQRREERYLLTTEGSGSGLWDWVPGTDKVYYSPYFRKLIGYNKKEFPSSVESFNKIIHPDDYDALWDLVEKHLKNKIPFQTEYRLLTKNHGYRWFKAVGQALWDKNGNPYRMSGAITDITEFKETREALSHSEEKFKALIDANKYYAIVILDAEGYIKTWNTGAELMSGYTAKDVVGEHFSILHSKQSIENKLPDYELKIAAEKGTYESEEFRIKKNGEIIWTQVSITALYNDRGGLAGYGEIAYDLSERQKIDQMKNEFISIVSHELRTPLTSIQGSLDLLMDGTVGKFPDSANELLDVARQNSERLIRLINEILDIEKIESGKMEFHLEELNIDSIVKEAIVANISYGDKFGVKIDLLRSAPNVIVNVDKDKLLQAITNLLSNAIKFSPAKGKVTVSVIDLGNGMVRVMVRDQGQGISKEFQQRIFQKFAQEEKTTSRTKSGTGLGLSITKAIIETLHGEIGFESLPGEGAKFFFDLPIVEYLVQPSEITVKEKKHTILICEDDNDTAKLLETILLQNNFKTVIANTCAEAKNILNTMSIEAILLDLVLPDKDGISFIKELHADAKFLHLPIVVISIKADKSRAELNGSAITVLEWINKPVDPIRLIDAIKLIKSTLRAHTLKILHIEDDTGLQRVVSNILDVEADITFVNNLQAANHAIKNDRFDLVILDLHLPDGSGVDLMPLLSEKNIPVIVFSAYELPNNYTDKVVSTLVKSKTTNKEFLDNVKETLKKLTCEVNHAS